MTKRKYLDEVNGEDYTTQTKNSYHSDEQIELGPITSSHLVNYNGSKELPTIQEAAKLSTIGNVLGYFAKSNPIINSFLVPLSAYDVMYDLEGIKKAFETKKGRIKSLIHLGLDYPFRLSEITKMPFVGKFDDWLPIGGLIDDFSQGFLNTDVLDNFSKIKDKVSKNPTIRQFGDYIKQYENK